MYDPRGGGPSLTTYDFGGPAAFSEARGYSESGRVRYLASSYGDTTNWGWLGARLNSYAIGGMWQGFGYDNDGQLDRATYSPGGGTHRLSDLEYDATGQVSSVTDSTSNGSLAPRTSCFHRRNDRRLLETVRGDRVRQRFSYDGEGRLTLVEQGAWGSRPGD